MAKINKWLYEREVQANGHYGHGWEYVATVDVDGPESKLLEDASLAYRGTGVSLRVVSVRRINPEWEEAQNE